MGTRDQHCPGSCQPPAHISTDSLQFAPRVGHILSLRSRIEYHQQQYNAHVGYLSIEGYDFEDPDTCHMQSWGEAK